MFPFYGHTYSRPKCRTWTEVPNVTATMFLSTHVEASSSNRRPLFQNTAKISMCHQSSCFDAPSHFVSNESSVCLALAADEHQSLRLAGGVFVASELLPRFVLCLFHFKLDSIFKHFNLCCITLVERAGFVCR
jgi:hypothetical protein